MLSCGDVYYTVYGGGNFQPLIVTIYMEDNQRHVI